MTSCILGIDLSGPSNAEDTAAALLGPGSSGWELQFLRRGLGDPEIVRLLAEDVPADASLTVGLDAPLSYNPGGGDRPGDRALRQVLQERGLPTGSVMTPTMTRMAYLTLRGISVARLILAEHPAASIAEVHPGGVMAVCGAPVQAVRNLKKDAEARKDLLRWLGRQGVAGLPAQASEHEVAAVAAALGAARWSTHEEAWRFPARLPHHPFDLII